MTCEFGKSFFVLFWDQVDTLGFDEENLAFDLVCFR
jgi:hypothetical protein